MEFNVLMEKSRREVASRCDEWVSRARGPRTVLAALVLAVSWPTLRWYGARMVDGSDEPWGVLALAVGFLFAGFAWRQGLAGWRVACSGAALLVPALGGEVMTPLVQAVFVAVALSFLVADRRCWLGHTGLFVLALPLISSLQFYGGFPLRWLIGKLSVGVLNLFGVGVQAQGTVMHWRGEMIVIDAPCSGVQMLWSSAFLACVLICIQKLTVRRSLLLLQVASLSAFAGNVLRNVLLFFVESGLVRVGAWAHDAIGVGVFCVVLAVIVWVGNRIARSMEAVSQVEEESGFVWRDIGRRPLVLGGFCLGLVVTLFSGRDSAGQLMEGAVARSEIVNIVREELLIEGWYPMVLDSRSAQYAKGFPGTIELYGKSDRRLVVRVIDRATRRYHLSADCYRAIGYATEPMPLLQDVDGTMWGRVMATRDLERVEVRERVISLDGQVWTDPSSWFWSAMLGGSEGPWVGYSESVPIRVTKF